MSTIGNNYFRHEYGRLVSSLTRRFGVRHIEAAEDAAQIALMRALESWRRTGQPDNPSAWLQRVAQNHLITEIRTTNRRQETLANHVSTLTLEHEDPDEVRLSSEVQDDLLRMLFVCCDDTIPRESQLVFALKILCGFSVNEIAHRLFITEANVYKRLGRARAKLRGGCDLDQPPPYAQRLPAVQRVLYLLFTEGYLSSRSDMAIRRELCTEGLRLAGLLSVNPETKTPSTFALVALMHLHLARLPARQDDAGSLLLLEEQDRTLWNRDEIALGLRWLARSAEGDTFSKYHGEAAIAAEHCLAKSFEQTRWDKVVELYSMLEAIEPSPLHRLNRAVAKAQSDGPAAGLEVLDGFDPPSWLEGSYMWWAVRADLHRRAGHEEVARANRRRALDAAPSDQVKALLQRRLSL